MPCRPDWLGINLLQIARLLGLISYRYRPDVVSVGSISILCQPESISYLEYQQEKWTMFQYENMLSYVLGRDSCIFMETFVFSLTRHCPYLYRGVFILKRDADVLSEENIWQYYCFSDVALIYLPLKYTIIIDKLCTQLFVFHRCP